LNNSIVSTITLFVIEKKITRERESERQNRFNKQLINC